MDTPTICNAIDWCLEKFGLPPLEEDEKQMICKAVCGHPLDLLGPLDVTEDPIWAAVDALVTHRGIIVKQLAPARL